jgi:hypothetical protein
MARERGPSGLPSFGATNWPDTAEEGRSHARWQGADRRGVRSTSERGALDPRHRAVSAPILFPGSAIASDAVSWSIDGRAPVTHAEIWPLPENAFAHPRSAGTFSRFLRVYVRERQAISLRDALAKTSLIPARILERSVPQMRRSGVSRQAWMPISSSQTWRRSLIVLRMRSPHSSPPAYATSSSVACR